MTVNLPNLSFTVDDYQWVNLGIRVINSADPGDRAIYGLEIGRYGSSFGAYRHFLSEILVDDLRREDLNRFDTTISIKATLRVRWVAADGLLHFEYDADGPVNGELWTPLRTFNPAATWGMIGGSFGIGIGGESESFIIPSNAGLWLDDFAASTASPTITTQPRSKSSPAGGSVTLDVSATGSGTLTYQWFKDSVAVNGATAASLPLTGLTTAQTGQYHVEVANAGGVTRSEAALVITLPAAGGTFSGSDNFNDNSRDTARWGTADFASAGTLVEANGRLEFRNSTTDEVSGVWGWHSGTAPYTSDWEARITVNLPALSFPADSEAYLGLTVLNSADPGDIVGVELTKGRNDGNLSFLSAIRVNDVDKVDLDTQHPTTSTIATLRVRWVAATARMHLEYNTNSPANGEGWTSLRTFDPAATWGMSSGSFLVGVFGGSENRIIASGDGIWLDDFAASEAPLITTQPQSQVASATSNVTFTVAATGSGLTYQWRKGGADLSGETSATLTLTNVSRAASGVYSVVVTSGGSSTPSSTATLRVIVPQQVSAQRGGGGQFQLLFADPDGGLGSDLARFEVHHTTNFLGASTVWVTNSGSFMFSNGKILFDDVGSAGTSRRFYRVIEK